MTEMRRLPRTDNPIAFQAAVESMFSKVRKSDSPFCENGGFHVEFFESTKCRNSELDIKVAKEQTWERFNRLVEDYLRDKSGSETLFWRIVPEDDLSDTYVVLRYDENGPDVDFATDKKCHVDKDWKRYAVYARFVVSG